MRRGADGRPLACVQTKSWLSWGSKQAEDAKDKTEAELERAKHAAKNEVGDRVRRLSVRERN